MGTKQGKTVPMLLRSLSIRTPALDGVAALALRAELTAMKICVAICAARSYGGKYFRDMARTTRNIYVHAAQRVARPGLMTEFRNSAER